VTIRRSHIPALDGVRGIAVLLVLAHHYGHPVVARIGWVGVDLFFVLSGFLNTGILLDTRDQERFFRTFYARRSLRIFPLYYGLLIVSFVVLPLTPLARQTGIAELEPIQSWLWLYGSNILLAWRNAWVLRNDVFGFGHLWSLAVEEHFYLVWPAVVYWVAPRQLFVVCIVGMVSALAGRLLWALSLPEHGFACYVLTPFRADSLIAGAIVAVLMRQTSDTTLRRVARVGLIAGAISVLAVTLWARGFAYTSTPVYTFGFSALSILFASLITLSITPGFLNRLLSTRPLRWFGRYSYGIYVFQGFFGPILHSRLGDLSFVAMGVPPEGSAILADSFTSAKNAASV
jgi:peptidoglycan/LPS O-acetylase OafA/YrhL